MKKFKLLTVLLFAITALMMFGCSKKEYTVTFESNGGTSVEAVVVEEGSLLQEVTSTKVGYTFKGWGKDAQFSAMWDFSTDTVNSNITLYAKWEVIVTPDPDPDPDPEPDPDPDPEPDPQPTVYTAVLVYGNGADNGEIKSAESNGSHFFTQPANPEKEYNDFSHWSLTENGTDAYDFSQAVTGDITLYAVYTPKYDVITTELDIIKFASQINPDLPAEVTITETTQFGKFKIEGGKTRFETSEGKEALNTQGKSIWFTLSGEGNNNSITISGKGASSSGDWVRITNEDTNEVVKEWTGIGSNVEFSDTIENLPAGNYVYTNYKSVRITQFTLVEKLPQGPVQGLELDYLGAKSNFLLGQEFSSDGLNVKLVYENGRVDNIDASQLVIMTDDFTTPGVKTVYVGYENYEASYTVNVCEAEEIVLYDYTLSSSRVTQHRQEVFAVNSEFNTNNLVVAARCLVPGSEDKYIEFILSSDEYSLTAPDMTTAGRKNVSVSYGELTATYYVEVVALPVVDNSGLVSIVIDNTIESASVQHGLQAFATINQGLQYLELLNLKDTYVKRIGLTAGQTFFEKVEISMPNVFICTVEVVEDSYQSTTDKSKFATICYDALAGQLDPSGTVIHSTDGSATISIRESAYNFLAQGVRFMNYYNSHALYLESKQYTNDTQAVACLVQADMAAFNGCIFESYHDTLYVQTGRHYFYNCEIYGRTDYIFGYDSTSVFKSCTITSIGAGLTEKNGGYVVATKGNLVNGNNILYGIVFNTCTFTGDENVQPGTVSIARGWDKGMTIMVMNSTISGHFSKEAYGYTESDLNDRYGKMNAEPVASQLLEYNNTGDGAITESIEGTCTYATSEQAARFESLLDIFTPNNGTTTYDLPWHPFEGKTAVIDFVDENGNVLYTAHNITYYGSVLTQSLIDAVIEEIPVPSGSKLVGLYLDASFETELDHTSIINEGTQVYVLFESAGNTFSVLYDEVTAQTEGWTVYMAKAGSSKIGNAEGINSSADASSLISCDKLAAGTDYLLSPVFDSTNKVVAKILGATTSTSNQVDILVEGLDAEGNVVTSLTALGSASKTTGYATLDGSNELVLSSESANIVQVRISCTTSGKNTCVLTCELICSVPVETVLYDEVTAQTEGWTVYMAKAGSSKIGNAEGINSSADASSLISCDKLAAGTDYLLSPVFGAGNNVVVKILGATTSTSNQVDILVEGLDAEGNVVTSLTAKGSASKTTGYATLDGSNELVLSSESANIVQVRISCTTSGKNTCVLTCELVISTTAPKE